MSRDVTLTAEVRDSLTVFPIESIRDFGVDAFVTARYGGVSEAPFDSLNLGDHVGDDPERVHENRRRVADAINVKLDQLIIVRQVHGSDVLHASGVTPASRADALVTDDDDVALAMLVADCIPLLLVDALTRRVGVLHAGWRGLHVGVIARALEHFATASRVHAFMGPSISKERYQVGPDVAHHFTHVEKAITPDVGDRFFLDLRRVATAQLRAAGVSDDQIAHSEQVTDGGAVFFSDRAQRPCGRFALVAKRAS